MGHLSGSTLLRNLPVGVIILRLDDPNNVGTFYIEDANEAASQVVGFNLEQLKGLPFRDIMPDLAAPVFLAGQKAYKTKRPVDCLNTYYESPRVHLWLNIRWVPLDKEPRLACVVENVCDKKQVEAERDTVLARHKAFVRGNLDMLHLVSRDGHFLDTHIGSITPIVPPVDYLGKHITDIFDPPIAERMLALVENAFNTGKVLQWEYQLPQLPGKFFEARFVRAGMDEVVIVVRDTTDRHQAEEELRRNEARVTALYELGGLEDEGEVVRFAIDTAVQFTESQIGFFHVFDAPSGTITLTAWSAGVMDTCTAGKAGDHYPLAVAGVWADAAREKRPVIYNDYQGLVTKRGYPTGHVPITRCMSVPIISGDQVVAIAGVANKTTDYGDADVRNLHLFLTEAWETIRRLRADEALRQSEERYRGIVETALDGFWAIDMDTGALLKVNDAYCALSGFTPYELIGKSAAPLVVDATKPLMERLREVRQKGSARWETLHIRKDGRSIDVDMSGRYIPSWGYGVFFIRDITSQKLVHARLEARVAERTRQLAASNEALQSFAYAASHDLREPLNKIKAFSDRLQAKYREHLDDKGLQYLDIMQTAAERMTQLIDDLLAYSRSSRGEEAPPVMLDLREVLHDVMSDLDVQIQEAHADIRIRSLPSVKAHPLRMRQVFQNLLSNALKFRRKDVPLVIEVEGYVELGWVVITFRDNGIGFDPTYADRIFTLFTRLHSRFEYPGTGIGLALCRRILDLYGGTITAAGEPDKGATFTIRMPRINSIG